MRPFYKKTMAWAVARQHTGWHTETSRYSGATGWPGSSLMLSRKPSIVLRWLGSETSYKTYHILQPVS